MLTPEYDQHVDAAVVEHPCPVLEHPFACALVDEVVLEVKDVRVVGCHADVHVDHCAAGGGGGWVGSVVGCCVAGFIVCAAKE